MEINDEEYHKYLAWKLEQLYQGNDTAAEHIKEISNVVLHELDEQQTRLDLTFDELEDLIKNKRSIFKSSVDFAVKKTLNHFPEHNGRTTRVMNVPNHGSFLIDLETGEFLDGEQQLYDDWVEGKIKTPEPPEPTKINPIRLALLTLPAILVLSFLVSSVATTINQNFGSLHTNEYRFAKPGQVFP